MPGTVLEAGDTAVVSTASVLMELATQSGFIAHNEPENTVPALMKFTIYR